MGAGDVWTPSTSTHVRPGYRDACRSPPSGVSYSYYALFSLLKERHTLVTFFLLLVTTFSLLRDYSNVFHNHETCDTYLY